MQTIEEYLRIINEAVTEKFGNSYVFGKSYVKNLCFSFDKDNLPYDEKKHLGDKAARAIIQCSDLPKGVYLKECQIIMEE